MNDDTAEAVAARVFELLLAAGTDAGDRVFADRQDAFGIEESPALLIELVTDDANPHARGVDRGQLVFSVVALTRSNGWRTAVNALRRQAHAALLADPQLAGLLSGLRRSRAEWHAASADLPFGYCAQQYSGQYLSPTASLGRGNLL